jgi:hypothetical protein
VTLLKAAEASELPRHWNEWLYSETVELAFVGRLARSFPRVNDVCHAISAIMVA